MTGTLPPQVGDVVHYYPKTQASYVQMRSNGNDVDAETPIAAVVVRVWNDSGAVNLKLLTDGETDVWKPSVAYAPDVSVVDDQCWTFKP